MVINHRLEPPMDRRAGVGRRELPLTVPSSTLLRQRENLDVDDFHAWPDRGRLFRRAPRTRLNTGRSGDGRDRNSADLSAGCLFRGTPGNPGPGVSENTAAISRPARQP